MVELRVDNVPDDLLERLKTIADRRQLSIDEVVVAVIEREVKKTEWWERWDKLPRIEVEIDSVVSIREALEENDRKFDDLWERRRQEYSCADGTETPEITATATRAETMPANRSAESRLPI